MKKNIFYIALVVSCVFILGCAIGGWKRFESKEGGFSVDFPGEPIVNTVKLPTDFGLIPLYVFVLNAQNEFIYSISFVDYPGNLFAQKTAEGALDAARDGVIANVQGQLLSESPISFKGYLGRVVEFSATEGKSYAKARFFLVNQRLYHIMVTTATERKSSYDIRRFLDSFKLIGGAN
ncbi:hypothetical protein ACFL2J_00190 [Candidatus Omnitrophota bacterium]